MAKKQPQFEELLAELEQLVVRLESGELSLDDALDCFEKGIQKVKLCRQILEQAEKKVQVLLKDQAGNLVEKPFEGEPPEESP